MAVEISFVRNREQRGFVNLLSCVACEWFLIFLLFVEAVFSYLLSKFAHYCDLETPCPLCSRLDHVLGTKKPGHCWNLICRNHKEEISSLAFCTIHGNLADVDGMCQECLMSVVMHKSSNSGACKLLVGKSWVDFERSSLQSLMLNKHVKVGSSGMGTCSCCSKSWRAKSSTEILLELEQASLRASKAHPKPPLPRLPGHGGSSRRGNLKRAREKFSGSMANQIAGRNGVDKMSHVGYTKIKFTSGSESEVPFSEDEDDGYVSSGCNFVKPKHEVKSRRRGFSKPPAGNVAAEKQRRQIYKKKGLETRSLSPCTLQNKILRERKTQSSHKGSPSLTQESVSPDGASQKSDVGSLGVSAKASMFSVPRSAALAPVSQQDSLDAVHSSSNIVTTAKSKTDSGTSKDANTPMTTHVEAPAKTSVDSPSSELKNNIPSDSVSQPESKECSHKHAVDPTSAFASSRHEGVRSPSQESISEVEGLASSDNSPGFHKKHGESRKDDKSISHAPAKASTFDMGGLSPKVDGPRPVSGTSPGSREKHGESRKGDKSISHGPEKASTSNAGGLSPKNDNPRPESDTALGSHEKHGESRKDDESISHAPEKASTDGMSGKSTKDDRPRPEGDTSQESHEKHGEFRKDGESISHVPAKASASDMGGLSRKDDCPTPENKYNESGRNKETEPGIPHDEPNEPTKDRDSQAVSSTQPYDEHNRSRKDEDSRPQAVSQVSMPEADGLLSDNTSSRTAHDEHNESMTDEVGGMLPKETGLRPIDESNDPRKDEVPDPVEVSVARLLRRSESKNYEPLNGIAVKEIEGESTIDHLRRQVEHDRNIIHSLYKELEEERNASAIAANEALVMITKLQEEKAALHTEALQYLRMMEEQAEYDMAALRRANELLAEKEKELEDLDIELDFYRNNLPDDPEANYIQNETSALEDHAADISESSPKENNHSIEKSGVLSENQTDATSKTSENSTLLHDRLKAVDTGQDFLKHASNLLWSGKDGLQLIQELADQLRELWKIEFKR